MQFLYDIQMHRTTNGAFKCRAWQFAGKGIGKRNAELKKLTFCAGSLGPRIPRYPTGSCRKARLRRRRNGPGKKSKSVGALLGVCVSDRRSMEACERNFLRGPAFLALQETQALAARLFVGLADPLGSVEAGRFFDADSGDEAFAASFESMFAGKEVSGWASAGSIDVTAVIV